MIHTTNRFLGAALAAASVTAALFWVMTVLIRAEVATAQPEERGPVVLSVYVEHEPEPIITRPPRPVREPIVAPEPLPPWKPEESGKGVPVIGQEGPGLGLPHDPGDLPLGIPDTDAVPLVRVPPEYPARAMARGTEGRVLVEFTISRVGTVEDAKIVAFEPTSVFNAAALKAVRQWRYEPKRVKGKTVAQPGQRIVIPFQKGDHRE